MEILDEFLDLNSFKKHKKICKGKVQKIFEVIDINTNEIYTAKTPLKEIDTFTKEDLVDYCHDINIISKLNHPSITSFIGYSPVDFKNRNKPVIITEKTSNITLASIIKLKNEMSQAWNDTKRLINIYGIASAISYLHSHNIIHCDLTSEKIFIDQNLYPKLQNFSYSIEITENSTVQDERLKRMELHLAPEVLKNLEYSTKSDVYGFSLIMYEIITSQQPFKKTENKSELIKAIVDDGFRPDISKSVPQCYLDLIKKCWSQNPEERPNFDQILTILETDPDFITETINKDEYRNYIRMIKESPVTFDSTQPILHIEEIERKRRSKIIENLILTKSAPQLIDFLNTECDEETTSFVFDRCLHESPDFFQILCKEGIELNNKIAHHKFASYLLFERDINISTLKQAKFHLMESIKQGFACSYFVLARLCFEFLNKRDLAFSFAEEGYQLGEKYSTCLLGYFIAHGVGTKKDRKKGVRMMLESGADDLCQIFATDIGIHYIDEMREKKKNEKEQINEQQIEANDDQIEITKLASIEEIIEEEEEALDDETKITNNKETSNDDENESSKLPKVEEEEEVLYDETEITKSYKSDKINKEEEDEANSVIDSESTQFTITADIQSDASDSQALVECEYDEFIEYEYDDSYDDHFAFKWFEKAYNMNQTRATINNYGLCFLYGIGTQKDVEKAKDIFKRGAEKGDTNSLYHLGFILEDTDPIESFKNYKNAALQGHINAKSKCALIQSKNGQTESLKKYKRIGSNVKRPKSSLTLLIDEINKSGSDELYKKEAEKGNQEALQILTVKYSEENDTENAYNYIEKLIKSGDCSIPIQYTINLYKMKKFKQAFNYFLMMLKINNPIAQYFIGVMKYHGEGCTKDVDEAYQILKNLSDNGIDRASDFIEDNF